MRIVDILLPTMLISDLQANNKTAILQEMARHMCKYTPALMHQSDEVLRALLSRERLGSTGVGDGVAIPHAKIGGLHQLVACFGRATYGIPFDAIDYQPVQLVFVLLVPENSAGVHLQALARISRLLKHDAFRARLQQSSDAASLYQAFVEEDAQH